MSKTIHVVYKDGNFVGKFNLREDVCKAINAPYNNANYARLRDIRENQPAMVGGYEIYLETQHA